MPRYLKLRRSPFQQSLLNHTNKLCSIHPNNSIPRLWIAALHYQCPLSCGIKLLTLFVLTNYISAPNFVSLQDQKQPVTRFFKCLRDSTLHKNTEKFFKKRQPSHATSIFFSLSLTLQRAFRRSTFKSRKEFATVSICLHLACFGTIA